MSRFSTRSAALTLAAGTLFSGAVAAQKVLYTYGGARSGDILGEAVASAGDVNADGYEDVVMGRPGDDTNANGAGAALIVSGRDGTILWSVFGDAFGDALGAAVAGVGDANGDGHDDVAVGIPGDDTNGSDAGMMRLYSGRDGTLIRSAVGAQPGDRYGYSVAAAGDANSDGVPDVLVGSPALGTGRNGRVQLVSGLGGALVNFGGGFGDDRLGFDCAGVGDLDDDGYDDLAMGLPGFGNGRGRVLVMSGRTRLAMWTFDGDGSNDELGNRVAAAGDVDGDAVPDVLVSAPFDDNAGIQSGNVRVYSGATGSMLYSIDGDAADDRLGTDVSRAGDLDGDGRDDFLVGAAQANGGAGYVRVFSGATGGALLTRRASSAGRLGAAVAAADVDCNGTLDLVLAAPDSEGQSGRVDVLLYPPVDTHVFAGGATGPANTEYGQGLAVIGDVNGDGYDDYVVGAPRDDAAGIDAGAVSLHSGADDSVLYATTGFNAGDLLGIRVAACGDVSGDGVPDFLAGATQEGTGSGYAVLYSGLGGAIVVHGGRNSGDRYGACVAGVGDFNGDGFPDFAVGGTEADNGGAGYLTVYSEHPRGAIVIHGGVSAGDQFGAACAAADVNGDARPDLFVGATQAGTAGSGYVRVLDAATNALIRSHTGAGAAHRFGAAIAAGDVDGDGVADAAIGAPFSSGGAPSGGAFAVFSGATGAPIANVDGSRTNQYLGYTIACADVDHDGFDDVVSGAPFWNGNRGYAVVHSVQRASELFFWGGSTPNRRGHQVAVGDVNRDGIADVLVGAPAGIGRALRFESRALQTGSVKFYGAPCSGSMNNRPRIDVIGKPVVGGRFIIDLTGARPSSTAILAWGIAPDADRLWAGLPLPLGLGLIGSPGCFALTAIDFSTIHASDAAGRAGATLVLPAPSVSIGRELFFQWYNFDVGANPLGLTTSNAAQITVGAP